MSEFTDRQIAARPEEARIIRKIIRALKAAGTPITHVYYDNLDRTSVRTEAEILEEVFNLDQAWLVTADGSWAFVVMGEGPEDMLADYTTDLEDALRGV